MSVDVDHEAPRENGVVNKTNGATPVTNGNSTAPVVDDPESIRCPSSPPSVLVNGTAQGEDRPQNTKDAPETDEARAPHKGPVHGINGSEHNHMHSEVKDAIAKEKKKLKDMTKPPGGFDTTPLPSAPPGYTVKFTFHRAANLPPADIATMKSDPFILATLKAPVPRRNKNEPDLTRRTVTRRRTTEPVWDDEWIVANVPAAGFTLKCRLYDEDYYQSDDRLGNVTVKINGIDENWQGIQPPGHEFPVKKRAGSKTAYLFKAITNGHWNPKINFTPSLWLSIQVLGLSPPPYAQMYTIGTPFYFKHFSPTIGRLTGTKVNKNEGQGQDLEEDSPDPDEHDKKKTQTYDFQSNEMQLTGPVPPELYHRYVEFRQSIGMMFSSRGVRGRIMNKALHKQHHRVYTFSSSTQHGTFAADTEEASLQFLRLAHFDEGGRIFTYVLTLDGMFRFTETGKEFAIDMLSKHTMHSDVATYIACSGEFLVRRLERPDASADPEPHERTHPGDEIEGGPPKENPPDNPAYYQLVIDNDSGTYRPDKSILPLLRGYLQRSFPGLGVVAMHWEDPELAKLKEKQHEIKKQEGNRVNLVMNRSMSGGSMSSISSAESDLDDIQDADERDPALPYKTKRERMLDAMAEPKKAKEVLPSWQQNQQAAAS